MTDAGAGGLRSSLAAAAAGVELWAMELAPGAAAALHTHRADYVFSVLEASTLEVFDARGASLGAVPVGPAGACHGFALSADGRTLVPAADDPAFGPLPATHSALNVGPTAFREVLFECGPRTKDDAMMKNAAIDDAEGADGPGGARLLHRGGRVAVWEARLPPGGSLAEHAWRCSALWVFAATAGTLEVRAAGQAAGPVFRLEAGECSGLYPATDGRNLEPAAAGQGLATPVAGRSAWRNAGPEALRLLLFELVA